MKKNKFQKFILILLAVLSFKSYADPYSEATTGIQSTVDDSFFGTHFHRIVLHNNEVGKFKFTEWPPLIIGSVRLWDSNVRWADVAPSPGMWNFSRMDVYINEATANKADVTYTLGSTPQWASARPFEKCPYGLGCSAEPANMSDWEEYVRTVSRRYKGKIAVYELWNEPFFSDYPRVRGPSSFFTGNVDVMIEMAKIARKVLDEEDSKAKLSTPGFDHSVEQLEQFLAAGGKKYVQTINFHFYSHDVKEMAEKLIKVRRTMQNQGVSKLPLLNTEQGVRIYLQNNNKQPGEVSQTEAAAKISQYLIFGAAGGFKQFFQYAWDNENMGGMVDAQRVKLPPYFTYIKTKSWLINSKMLGCSGLAPDGVLCHAEKSGKRFFYAWALKAGSYRLSLPDGYSVASMEKLNDTEVVNINENTNMFNLDDAPIRIQLKLK